MTFHVGMLLLVVTRFQPYPKCVGCHGSIVQPDYGLGIFTEKELGFLILNPPPGQIRIKIKINRIKIKNEITPRSGVVEFLQEPV